MINNCKFFLSAVLTFFCFCVFSQQKIIYQTGFENIQNSLIISTISSDALDYWKVNNNDVQKTELNTLFSQRTTPDKFRNLWIVTSNYYPIVCGDKLPDCSVYKPIQGQSLGISATWGADGLTWWEQYKEGTAIISEDAGVFAYWLHLPTDRWVLRTISSLNFDTLSITFNWKGNGIAGEDYGQAGYSLNYGATWKWFDKKYYGQNSTQLAVIDLPAECDNNPRLTIGFRFISKGTGPNQTMNKYGPAFMIDNFVLKGTPIPPCNPPLLTASANNYYGKYKNTVSGGIQQITLSANPSGGSGCLDKWLYSWYNGNRYWDGDKFNSFQPVWKESYNNIIFSANDSAVFSVSVKCGNNASCYNSSDVTVVILKSSGSIDTISNILTFNNKFGVRGKNLKSFDITIFNRWGVIVFHNDNFIPESSDINKEGINEVYKIWDGKTDNGSEVPAGVYFYVLIATTLDNVVLEKKSGNITVIR